MVLNMQQSNKMISSLWRLCVCARVCVIIKDIIHNHTIHTYRTTVLCPDLPDPENGQVSLSGMTEGSLATYQCDAGFFPTDGVAVRICEAGGEWSGSAPTCQGITLHYLHPHLNRNTISVILVLVYWNM